MKGAGGVAQRDRARRAVACSDFQCSGVDRQSTAGRAQARRAVYDECAAVDGRSTRVSIHAGKRPGARPVLGHGAGGRADNAGNAAIARASQSQPESRARNRARVGQVQGAAVRRKRGRTGQGEQSTVIVRSADVDQRSVLSARACAGDVQRLGSNRDPTFY